MDSFRCAFFRVLRWYARCFSASRVRKRGSFRTAGQFARGALGVVVMRLRAHLKFAVVVQLGLCLAATPLRAETTPPTVDPALVQESALDGVINTVQGWVANPFSFSTVHSLGMTVAGLHAVVFVNSILPNEWAKRFTNRQAAKEAYSKALAAFETFHAATKEYPGMIRSIEERLALLPEKIREQQAAGNDVAAEDLRDKQDQLRAQLNRLRSLTPSVQLVDAIKNLEGLEKQVSSLLKQLEKRVDEPLRQSVATVVKLWTSSQRPEHIREWMRGRGRTFAASAQGKKFKARLGKLMDQTAAQVQVLVSNYNAVVTKYNVDRPLNQQLPYLEPLQGKSGTNGGQFVLSPTDPKQAAKEIRRGELEGRFAHTCEIALQDLGKTRDKAWWKDTAIYTHALPIYSGSITGLGIAWYQYANRRVENAQKASIATLQNRHKIDTKVAEAAEIDLAGQFETDLKGPGRLKPFLDLVTTHLDKEASSVAKALGRQVAWPDTQVDLPAKLERAAKEAEFKASLSKVVQDATLMVFKSKEATSLDKHVLPVLYTTDAVILRTGLEPTLTAIYSQAIKGAFANVKTDLPVEKIELEIIKPMVQETLVELKAHLVKVAQEKANEVSRAVPPPAAPAPDAAPVTLRSGGGAPSPLNVSQIQITPPQQTLTEINEEFYRQMR